MEHAHGGAGGGLGLVLGGVAGGGLGLVLGGGGGGGQGFHFSLPSISRYHLPHGGGDGGGRLGLVLGGDGGGGQFSWPVLSSLHGGGGLGGGEHSSSPPAWPHGRTAPVQCIALPSSLHLHKVLSSPEG